MLHGHATITYVHTIEHPADSSLPAISLDAKVQALRSPASYDEPCDRIDSIETHFAWVFLTDRYAYKLKKPLQEAFLDLSTLTARAENCSNELHLNRRLSPQIYLAAVPLVQRTDGELHIGGAGTVVDWLVKMQRLPATLMLDRLIAPGSPSGAPSAAALHSVGRLLADFYQRATCMEFDPATYVARIAAQIATDGTELSAPDLHLPPRERAMALTTVETAFEHSQHALAQRAHERRIIEAHGDLRPEHICLTEPPCIIDSLEFSQDLRILDPLEELAFLSIECARGGNAWAGEQVLDAYRRSTGDSFRAALFEFYCSRRAMVRAKIAAWHLRDPAVSDHDRWREQARAYLACSITHATQCCLLPAARSRASRQQP